MQKLHLSLMTGALLRHYALMIRSLFGEPALERQTLTLERLTSETVSRVASCDRRLRTLLPTLEHGGHLDLPTPSVEPELFVRTFTAIIATNGALGTHDLHSGLDKRSFKRRNP